MATPARHATLQEVAKLFRTQKVSPVEIVEECLKQIEDLNPKLNAFITILADEAREQAQEAEAEIRTGKWRGPLYGIPVGIKDFYDTAGIRTTAGFEHFKDRIPTKDAESVRKLKRAGAIIIGKMNMHHYFVNSVSVTFGDPSRSIRNIEADRKAIAGQAFKNVDVLLLPTSTSTVPAIKDAGTDPQALSTENTAFANYYDLPAISIPCGFDANGLPLSFQIVGKPWDESAVLRLAYQFQTTTEYR